jgi:hypothetical protein
LALKQKLNQSFNLAKLQKIGRSDSLLGVKLIFDWVKDWQILLY